MQHSRGAAVGFGVAWLCVMGVQGSRCRAVGFGEGASLRAFDAFCHLRVAVGPALGEGHVGPREVASALRQPRGGIGACSTVWGVGLQGVCLWCMERLST